MVWKSMGVLWRYSRAKKVPSYLHTFLQVLHLVYSASKDISSLNGCQCVGKAQLQHTSSWVHWHLLSLHVHSTSPSSSMAACRCTISRHWCVPRLVCCNRALLCCCKVVEKPGLAHLAGVSSSKCLSPLCMHWRLMEIQGAYRLWKEDTALIQDKRKDCKKREHNIERWRKLSRTTVTMLSLCL